MHIGFLFSFIGEQGGIPKLEHSFVNLIKKGSVEKNNDTYSFISYKDTGIAGTLILKRGFLLNNISRIKEFIRKNNIDIIFYHYHTFPLFLLKTPYIIEIHDTNPFKDFVPYVVTILNALRAKAIIVPSQSTKNNLGVFFKKRGLSRIQRKIYVAPNPILEDQEKKLLNPQKTLIEKYGIEPKKYFFTLGADDNDFICTCMEEAGVTIPIVIGGKIRKEEQEQLKKQHHINSIFTGYVDEETLAALYAYATAVVYKNANEGFGYIPLEAAIAKVIVITNPDTSIKEVLQNAGHYYTNKQECITLIQNAQKGILDKKSFNTTPYSEISVFEKHIEIIKNVSL